MIIGLSGLSRSGKSLVQELVCESNAMRCRPMAWADTLKDAARPVLAAMGYPVPNEGFTQEFKAQKLKGFSRPGGKTPTVRYLLQTLGTEWGREHLDTDVWAKIGMLQAKRHLEAGYDCVLVTDCRFVNEAKIIRDDGGEVWYVSRPKAFELAEQHPEIYGHASETTCMTKSFQDLVSVRIHNDGTRNQLADKVAKQLDRLVRRLK